MVAWCLGVLVTWRLGDLDFEAWLLARDECWRFNCLAGHQKLVWGVVAEQARSRRGEPTKARPSKRGILGAKKSEQIPSDNCRFWVPKECQHKAHRYSDTSSELLEISSKHEETI